MVRPALAKVPLREDWPTGWALPTSIPVRCTARWRYGRCGRTGSFGRAPNGTVGAGCTIELAAGSRRVLLNGEDVTEAIRTAEVAQAASIVAAIAGVRRAMVAKQREIGARASAVMEGRDIGSVVFPDADVKIFLDATRRARAAPFRRRASRERSRCARGSGRANP